jgi:hypothetical protein
MGVSATLTDQFLSGAPPNSVSRRASEPEGQARQGPTVAIRNGNMTFTLLPWMQLVRVPFSSCPDSRGPPTRRRRSPGPPRRHWQPRRRSVSAGGRTCLSGSGVVTRLGPSDSITSSIPTEWPGSVPAGSPTESGPLPGWPGNDSMMRNLESSISPAARRGLGATVTVTDVWNACMLAGCTLLCSTVAHRTGLQRSGPGSRARHVIRC